MAETDLIVENDPFSDPSRPDADSEILIATAYPRFKLSSSPNANRIRDRLSPIREYLADPSPDPQWEKMMSVLNVLLDIFWMVASMAVFHFTDFYIRVLYDRNMDRNWLLGSGIAFSLDLIIGSYYIVYLTCIRGVRPACWDNHWRWGFPLATLLFFAGCISFTVAAWQVWWFFSPFILFLFFMGFITVVSYIPDFGRTDLDPHGPVEEVQLPEVNERKLI